MYTSKYYTTKMKIIRWYFPAFVAVVTVTATTAIICDSFHGNYLPRVVWHIALYYEN